MTTKKTENPLTLVYRDNDFYEVFIPTLVKILDEKGIQAETYAFPRGTPEDIIRSEFRVRHQDFSGEIVTDGTVARNVPDGLRSSLRWTSLDTVSEDLINLLNAKTIVPVPERGHYREIKTILSRLKEERPDLKNDQGRMRVMEQDIWTIETARYMQEQGEQVFIPIFKDILERRQPEKVVISRDNIHDHEPFLFLKYEYYGSPMVGECYKNWGIMPEGLETMPTDGDGWVKIWIEKTGYNREIVEGSAVDTSDKNILFIADRHHLSYKHKKTGENIVPLPLPNLVQYALQEGYLDRDRVNFKSLAEKYANRFNEIRER